MPRGPHTDEDRSLTPKQQRVITLTESTLTPSNDNVNTGNINGIACNTRNRWQTSNHPFKLLHVPCRSGATNRLLVIPIDCPRLHLKVRCTSRGADTHQARPTRPRDPTPLILVVAGRITQVSRSLDRSERARTQPHGVIIGVCFPRIPPMTDAAHAMYGRKFVHPRCEK